MELSFVAPQPVRQTDRRRPRFAIAAHECAHAVTALYFNWIVKSVDVIRQQAADGQWRNGRCVCRPPSRRKGVGNPYQNAIITAAGAVGERLAGGRNIGGQSDKAENYSLAAVLAGSLASEKALLRYVHEEARHIVEVNWPKVEALASVLLERGRLTGREVNAVLAPIESEWKARFDEHTREYGRPDLLQWRETERQSHRHTVERRHIAEAALRFLAHRIAQASSAPINPDEVDIWLAMWAARYGFNPAALQAKFATALSSHRAAIRWRPVTPITFVSAAIPDGEAANRKTEATSLPRSAQRRRLMRDKGATPQPILREDTPCMT